MGLELEQVFTQILSFLIMFWILKRFAWKPLLQIMEERKNKIRSDFKNIEEQKKEVHVLSQDYLEKLNDIEALGRVKMQEAIEEGRQMAQEIKQDAHEQARSIILKAQEDLQKEIYKAKMQLKKELIDLALVTTEKMIEESLTPEKQKKLVSEFVDQAELN